MESHCSHNGIDTEHIHSHPDEIPAVFSASLPVCLKKEISAPELISMLTYWFNGLKVWTAEHHYFIGHIKSYVSDGDKLNLWIATTGKEINIKNTEKNIMIKDITVNITAIIFGADVESIKEVSLKSLRNCLNI